jgi:hypothetical protein
MRPVTMLVAGILGVISVAHLARIIFGIEAVIGGVVIPQWMSAVGFLAAGALAVALWREGRRRS